MKMIEFSEKQVDLVTDYKLDGEEKVVIKYRGIVIDEIDDITFDQARGRVEIEVLK